MYIKYVHIHGQQRNALLLTVLDVFTRSIVGQILWWHMRKEQVIWLLHNILQEHQQPTRSITVRNDNGNQFIAHALRGYLKNKGVAQEFLHVATPEENCYIEAYTASFNVNCWHSVSSKSLAKRSMYSAGGRNFTTNAGCTEAWGTKTPAKIWEEHFQLEQQAIREQELRAATEPLCTNGERKSLQFEESRLCIKLSQDG